MLAPASQSAEDTDTTWPLRELPFTRGILGPDLGQIPKDRWREAMRTIPVRLRINAIQGIGETMEELGELAGLANDLSIGPAPSDLARAAAASKPQLAPRPAADAFRRASRQVNFRLTEEEYVDLATAAQIIGTTPTGLAAMLTRNGVRRVIEEANRRDG